MKSLLAKHCSTNSAQRARLRADSSFMTSPMMYLTAFTVSGALAAIVSAVVLHVSLELGLRHDAIDQPHPAGLLGVELARGEEESRAQMPAPTTSTSRRSPA